MILRLEVLHCFSLDTGCSEVVLRPDSNLYHFYLRETGLGCLFCPRTERNKAGESPQRPQQIRGQPNSYAQASGMFRGGSAVSQEKALLIS